MSLEKSVKELDRLKKIIEKSLKTSIDSPKSTNIVSDARSIFSLIAKREIQANYNLVGLFMDRKERSIYYHEKRGRNLLKYDKKFTNKFLKVYKKIPKALYKNLSNNEIIEIYGNKT